MIGPRGWNVPVTDLVPTTFAPALTAVVSVSLSSPVFGSAVVDDTIAVLLMTVPFGVPGATCTTSVKTALPRAMFGFVHVTVPVAPTPGVTHVQPAGESQRDERRVRG